jgi:cytochrome b involved in lipid metabolism
VAGQEATEEFEDVGHSEGAREQLAEHVIGSLKGWVAPVKSKSAGGDGAFPMFVIPLLLVIIAVAYKMFVLDAA